MAEDLFAKAEDMEDIRSANEVRRAVYST